MDQIYKQLFNLLINGLIAWLVWRYYKGRRSYGSERYSTFGPRFWTGSVDSCVMWPLGFALTLLYTLSLPTVVSIVLVIMGNLAWLIYTVIMHAKYGQTVGKMVCKVRVVDHATEGSITLRQACLREGIPILLGVGIVIYEIFLISSGSLTPAAVARGDIAKSAAFWWLAALPGFWFLAEVLTMLTNEKRRALHDFIAGTVVVRTNTSD